MRTVRFIIAATIAASIPSIPVIRDVQAQETIVMEDAAMPGMDGADCNCRAGQRPPWHGNVEGEACGCGPVCRTHGMFHADSCGQLRAKRHVHQGHVTLPPCFPRLHAMWCEGQMPSPQPPHLPRCHHCGAVIVGGF